tara:strand:- start:128 stop:895 length:768 start_codon:yes stop_codon:yes gene_type:complete
MLFKKQKIYLSGGIGNQILHLLILIDDCIKKEIDPKDLEIIVCKYKSSLKDKQYHNLEEIKNYLVFNSKVKIISKSPKSPLKKVKFTPQNAIKIVNTLTNDYKTYFKINENIYKESYLRKNIIWLRGLERKFNIKILEKKVLELFDKDELNKSAVLTNDKELLMNSEIFSKRLIGGIPLTDFNILLNAKTIVSQFSGFSLAPFLISDLDQEFILLGKSTHLEKEFPFLEQDLKFTTIIFDELCKKKVNKKFQIID